MSTLLSIIGIIGSFFLIRYRQQVGDTFGEADWMRNIGGVYNAVVIVAVIIFFWSVAELTGTTNVFFRPILFFLPGVRSG